MSNAFDKFTDLGSVTGTSLTSTHTVTGLNPYLYVGTLGDLTSDLITVKAGTSTMTKLGVVQIPTDRFTTLFGLSVPAGAISVVASATSSIFMGAVAASYVGAGSLESTSTGTASASSSILGTVNTVAANCWTVALFGDDNGAAGAGAGTTTRGNGSLGALSIMDSNADLSPGAHTLRATNGANPNWGVVITSLAPLGGATIWDDESRWITVVQQP